MKIGETYSYDLKEPLKVPSGGELQITVQDFKKTLFKQSIQPLAGTYNTIQISKHKEYNGLKNAIVIVLGKA